MCRKAKVHVLQARVLATIGVTRGLGDHDLKVHDSNIYIKPFLSCCPEVRARLFAYHSEHTCFVNHTPVFSFKKKVRNQKGDIYILDFFGWRFAVEEPIFVHCLAFYPSPFVFFYVGHLGFTKLQ